MDAITHYLVKLTLAYGEGTKYLFIVRLLLTLINESVITTYSNNIH